MDASIESLERTRVAFVRHTGPYTGVGSAWEALCGVLGPKGLLGPNTRFLGVCHDDPDVTPPEKIRYDACATVGEAFQPEGAVEVQDIGGGEYAATIHQGPYENLSKTYAALCGEWIPGSGREVASAPSIEVYLSDLNSTPPEDLRTEVLVPLEKRP